jgi:hypothetical protein
MWRIAPSIAGIFLVVSTSANAQEAVGDLAQSGASVASSETRGVPGSPRSSDPRCKLVGDDWTWFSDHVALTVTYVVQGSSTRNYEVGTGVSAFGKPRGRKVQLRGKNEVTAYGMGALHVRVVDGGSPTTICVAQGDLSTITFVDIEF